MSKRALAKYLETLEKEDLTLQLMALYDRFPEVKVYYDFVFNPKEDKLVHEAKTKITNEYFPMKRKRPKARRSVAQKYLRHFRVLEMQAHLVADLMLYNLEIAQSFTLEKNVPEAFYKSMLNSFKEALQYIAQHQLLPDFKVRILKCYRFTQDKEWPNKEEFSWALELLDA